MIDFLAGGSLSGEGCSWHGRAILAGFMLFFLSFIDGRFDMRAQRRVPAVISCLASFVLPGMAALVMMLATARPSEAEVIYRQTFGVATTNENASPSSVGWIGVDSGTSTWNTGRGLLSWLEGRPNNLPNVNTGTLSASESGGFAFWGGSSATAGSSATRNALLYTTQYTVDRSANEVATISAYMGNSTPDVTQRFAIQIGSDWFVSETAFTTAAMASGTTFSTAGESKSLAFSTAGSAWRDFDFNPASNSTNPGLTLGSLRSNPLPSGDITAFGVYLVNPLNVNQTFRTDTYEIVIVPEPGTTAVLVVAGCGLVLLPCRRRRRTA